MGSWANTLFVKADDARTVVAEIETLLLERGYKPGAAPAKSQVGAGWMARQDQELVADFFAQGAPGGTQAGAAVKRSNVDSGFKQDDFDDEFDEDLDVGGFDEDGDPDDGRFGVYGDFPSAEPEAHNVCIFEPRAGWVGVMDSSLEGNLELTRELSARLSADTMLVLVNDSDSWNYLMYRDGVEFDEFDSANGAMDDDGDEPTGEWLEAMENQDDDKLHELLMSKAPQNIKFPHPDIGLSFQLGALGAKIASGQATFWERLKYRWLSLKFLFKLLTGGFSAQKMDFGFDVPHTPMDDDTLARHLERIKAFFPNASENELRELLPKCRFPSEDPLRKFLAIVGLPWFYAYLSYDYLSEHSERELASHGIVQVAELRFNPPGAAA
jgi:hypothetical protein